MVKPKFLMQGAEEKSEGIEVPMRLPAQIPQAESLNIVRSDDRNTLERGYYKED
jgi:hypothetical protein